MLSSRFTAHDPFRKFWIECRNARIAPAAAIVVMTVRVRRRMFQRLLPGNGLPRAAPASRIATRKCECV
jgi:hypothetical protein